jgi:hypothetical protein
LLTGLKVLNLRYNDLTKIPAQGLRQQSLLEELIVEDNKLTQLDEVQFETQTNLVLLRLGGNQITELHENLFLTTGKLKVLRLENNLLTDINPKTFDIQQGCAATGDCLEELHLQRNKLTQLQNSVFAKLVGLKRLYIQVNPGLTLIPQSVFKAGLSPATTLDTLSMLGSASTCDRGSKTRPIQCTCAVGHVDGSGGTNEGSYCERVDCGATIVGLAAAATATCAGLYEDTCDATCNTGYVGAETFVCGADGLWQGTLECVAVSCAATIPDLDATTTNSETVCGEATTLFNGEPCLIECQEGYAPKDGTTGEFRCQADKSWKGDLECVPVDCGNTVDQLKQGRFEYVDGTGTSPTVVEQCEGDTTFNGDNCFVRCTEGYTEIEQTAVKEFTCSKEGLWEGEIDCRGKRCGRDADVAENTVARCLGDVTFGGDKCGVSCISGYQPKSGTLFGRISGLYCSQYKEKCLASFEQEFGFDGVDDADSSASKLCLFEARRLLLGDNEPGFESTDSLFCRYEYLKEETFDCSAARLGDNKQCARKICREGSLECLECRDEGEGQWSASKLECEPITCDATREEMQTRSCDEQIGADAVAKCLADFDQFADPALGPACAGTNNFEDECAISCGFGYSPKDVPFSCQADQLGNGLWVGKLDCKPVVCPIGMKGSDVRGAAKLDGMDRFAVFEELTPTDADECAHGARLVVGELGDADTSAAAGSEPALGDCAPDATYDPAAPTTYTAVCKDGVFSETYKIECSDPSWLLVDEVFDSHQGGRKGQPLLDWQSPGRFCRRDCGEFVSFAVKNLQSNAALRCDGTLEGDRCEADCRMPQSEFFVQDPNERYVVEFECDYETTSWVNVTENICEALYRTTMTTTTTNPPKLESGLSSGAQAMVIIFPILILLLCLLVILYYFGCLKRFGLSATKDQLEIYGELYSEIYGQADASEIYASAVAKVKGRKKGGGGGATSYGFQPRVPTGPPIKGRSGGPGNASASASKVPKIQIKGRKKRASDLEERSTGTVTQMEINPMFSENGAPPSIPPDW